ncbi:DEAD/DEAH box helicase [Portibacter marinus]|uniref:DEAD/DEAH box helicase n=1 Tax=Portibacter marinus TaxID=2898660 RepID=UPI001F3983D4|nr:DEAD/DEAH box helicase [Portibacter marinus]
MQDTSFEDLNLNNSLRKAINELGLIHPTTIQKEAFAPIMSGRDVIGLAQTGTGKTFAYLLPALRQWKYSKDRFPQILIVVPTRELVVQVFEEVEKLAAYMSLEAVAVYGGANIKPQIVAVESGCDLVVATPGRLLDLCLKGALKLRAVKKFIIDEVDEMLNLGFLHQLKRVIEFLPKKRQNLLFSATMTEDVEEIIKAYFNSPIKIEAAPMGTPLENIEQTVYYARNYNTKFNLLVHLLKANDEYEKVLIFMSTKRMADRLYESLDGIFPEQVSVIHSNKSQNFRFNAVDQFTNGTIRILIATDIVARGIDVSEVSHVINFDVPEQPENYVHRIGRTGRADKKGVSITLSSESESEALAAVEKLMNYNIPLQSVPEEVEISDELIPEELPEIKIKNVVIPRANKGRPKGAFHEKKLKNQKVNQKRTRKKKTKNKKRR